MFVFQRGWRNAKLLIYLKVLQSENGRNNSVVMNAVTLQKDQLTAQAGGQGRGFHTFVDGQTDEECSVFAGSITQGFQFTAYLPQPENHGTAILLFNLDTFTLVVIDTAFIQPVKEKLIMISNMSQVLAKVCRIGVNNGSVLLVTQP